MIDPNMHNTLVLLDATRKQMKALSLKANTLEESLLTELEMGQYIIESNEFGAANSYTILVTSQGVVLKENKPREEIKIRTRRSK